MHLRRHVSSFLGLVLPLSAAATAHAEMGLFTTYDSRVSSGEVEVMLMNDFLRPSGPRREEGVGNSLAHMLELEYGATSQLALEAMGEWYEDLEAHTSAFTGYRLEARYRLFKGDVPGNPMIYAEYEDLAPDTRYKMEVSGWVRPPYAAHESGGRERVLESRLVLSQSFGPFDVAANWINETDLREGTTAFGYSAGIVWTGAHGGGSIENDNDGDEVYHCPMHPDVASHGPGQCPRCGMALVEGHGGVHVTGGLELFGGLGDTHAFGVSPGRQEHYLAPTLIIHPAPHWMVHAQVAVGLTGASDQLVRLNLAYEL